MSAANQTRTSLHRGVWHRPSVSRQFVRIGDSRFAASVRASVGGIALVWRQPSSVCRRPRPSEAFANILRVSLGPAPEHSPARCSCRRGGPSSPSLSSCRQAPAGGAVNHETIGSNKNDESSPPERYSLGGCGIGGQTVDRALVQKAAAEIALPFGELVAPMLCPLSGVVRPVLSRANDR